MDVRAEMEQVQLIVRRRLRAAVCLLIGLWVCAFAVALPAQHHKHAVRPAPAW